MSTGAIVTARATLILLALVMATTTVIAATLTPDPCSTAAELSGKGDAQGALTAAQSAATAHPADWLAQASLSYHSWQLGDNYAAIRAGMEAAKYNPNSLLALSNLACMEEALGSQRDALVLYERLSKIAPHDPGGGIGQARCYANTDNRERAISILREMSLRNRDSFDWNYQLGQTLLRLNEPVAAAEAATRAVDCTENQSMQAKAKALLLLSLIVSNQTSKAEALAPDVFDNCHPTRHEVFVRAAEKLCQVTKPESGEKILTSALANLSDSEDAEGFFKLGRVFQNKAAYVSFDRHKYSRWQHLAGEAYKTALDKDKMQFRYYVAYAGVLAQQQKFDEATQALQDAQKMMPTDSLTTQLLAAARQKQTFNSLKARFSTKGINCTCHFGRIEQELTKVKGVSFAAISRVEPFEGVMLVDRTTSPVQVMNTCKTNLTGGPETKLFKEIDFKILSCHPVSGAEEATRIAQDATVGDPLLYFDYLPLTPPRLPTPQDRSATTITLHKKRTL